jgi:hypothetical protein
MRAAHALALLPVVAALAGCGDSWTRPRVAPEDLVGPPVTAPVEVAPVPTAATAPLAPPPTAPTASPPPTMVATAPPPFATSAAPAPTAPPPLAPSCGDVALDKCAASAECRLSTVTCVNKKASCVYTKPAKCLPTSQKPTSIAICSLDASGDPCQSPEGVILPGSGVCGSAELALLSQTKTLPVCK